MKYWVLIGLDEILKFGFHKGRIYSLCLLPEPWDYDQVGQHMDLVISHRKVVKILALVEVCKCVLFGKLSHIHCRIT